MALRLLSQSSRRCCAGLQPPGITAFALALMMAIAPAAADSSKDAIKSSVEGDSIQNQRPDESAGSPSRTQDQSRDQTQKSIQDSENQQDIQHDRPTETPDPQMQVSLSPLNLSWLPYVIVGVIGIGLLLVLIRYLHFRGGPRPAAAKSATPVKVTAVAGAAPPPEPERDRTFDEVDALAASGAFTEAIHRLLLLVQGRLRHRIEHGFQVSLTSRELLRRAKLPAEAATAFATLVAAVEISLFGMQSANAATYALCREQSARVLAAARE